MKGVGLLPLNPSVLELLAFHNGLEELEGVAATPQVQNSELGHWHRG